MGVSAWDRPGPVAKSGHINPLPDAFARPVFVERPVRGERVGCCRMVCWTCVLEALSAIGLVETLSSADPVKLSAFRTEMEALISEYFADNVIRQGYLLTRAVKL